jgi:hypothetical protein
MILCFCVLNLLTGQKAYIFLLYQMFSLDGKNAAGEIVDWRRKMREMKKVNKIYAKWRLEENAKQKLRLRIRGQPLLK